MRFDNYVKAAAEQHLNNDDLALIRQTAVKMAEDIDTLPASTVLLKMLNHINLITVNNTMVDVLALQKENEDLKLQIKAMGQGYFKLAMENEELQTKLESLGVEA